MSESRQGRHFNLPFLSQKNNTFIKRTKIERVKVVAEYAATDMHGYKLGLQEDSWLLSLESNERRAIFNPALQKNLAAIEEAMRDMSNAEIIELIESFPDLKQEAKEIEQVLRDLLIERKIIKKGDNSSLLKLISICNNRANIDVLASSGHLGIGITVLSSSLLAVPGLNIGVFAFSIYQAMRTANNSSQIISVLSEVIGEFKKSIAREFLKAELKILESKTDK